MELPNRLQTELLRLRGAVAYVVPGNSDQDTYEKDAAADAQWRLNFPDLPMSAHPQVGNVGDKD